MAGSLDFLQAASNSAASNVSGPVDGLAWLLRKAGLDVGEPVGGSDWMQRKGLTRPVEPGLLGMAGETAGLLAPVAAAAKAPQIARGLLQMGENAAAPKMLGSQRGVLSMADDPQHDISTAAGLKAKLLEAYEAARGSSPYSYFGVRVVGPDAKIVEGSKLARSSKWVDGVPTSTKLPGTAVFQLSPHNADKVLNEALAYNLGANGQKLALVVGDELGKSSMPERFSALIKQPTVLSVFDRPQELSQVTRHEEILKLLGRNGQGL
jgi:hypothetical protein